MVQATRPRPGFNLEKEIARLEADLATLQRTNIWKLERRVNRLLDLLDEPADQETKGDKLRERLLTIAATAVLTAGLLKSPNITFDQAPKQEQTTPKFAKPGLNLVPSSAPSLDSPAKPEAKPEAKPGLNLVPSSAPSLDSPAKPETKPGLNLAPLQNLEEAQALFTSHQSLGPRAICEAEGNCSNGQKTKIYYGHTDPGNFVRNFGWCSDQSKGGGTPEGGDKYCLEMLQKRLSKIWGDFQKTDLRPTPEEFINAADLYNQAAPEVSRQFPAKLKEYKEKGQVGIEALANARVASFYFDGKNTAGGLLGICRREGRGLSDWDCVLGDQIRRVKAINAVIEFQPSTLDKTRQLISSWSEEFQKDPVEGESIAGYPVTSSRGMRVSPTTGEMKMHQGVDIGMPVGTPIRAIADGQIQCEYWSDAGIVGLFTSEEFPGLRFDLLHLSKCIGNQGSKISVKKGDVIAWSGTAGTGPHLHLAIKSQSGKFLRVRSGWIYWFLSGKNPLQK